MAWNYIRSLQQYTTNKMNIDIIINTKTPSYKTIVHYVHLVAGASWQQGFIRRGRIRKGGISKLHTLLILTWIPIAWAPPSTGY